MNKQPVTVAIAILYREGKFLLQLRDNIPNIIYPGSWGLFGGHLEPGETPDEALVRELEEEINYIPTAPQQFRCYTSKNEDRDLIRHVYHAELTVPMEQLVLGEGWDFDLVSPEAIYQGSCYSEKAGEVRPIGKPHQKILLDFLSATLSGSFVEGQWQLRRSLRLCGLLLKNIALTT